MVHWVYVLECDDDYIYVGETTRLYRRFNEHITSRGGANTIKHKPKKLIGLYKVNDNYSFMRYRKTIKTGEYNRFIIDDWENEGDNLLIENHITERFLYERRENDSYGGGLEWYKVRGGKYTKESNSRNPIETIPVDSIVDRPLCKCHCPSEVKLSKDKSKIYFVCALKNVWGDFFADLDIDEPCDFWQLYTEDSYVKIQYENIKARSKESWVLNVPFSRYKINSEPCIFCSKTGYIGVFNNGTRRLCSSCLMNNYDSLKEKYDKQVCLITD